jgi:hypothetical protein
MNRLNLLMLRWKAGSIKDPDLSLALKYIHSITQDVTNENRSRVDSAPREDNSSDPSGPKSKRLRQRVQGGSDRSAEQDQSNV